VLDLLGLLEYKYITLPLQTFGVVAGTLIVLNKWCTLFTSIQLWFRLKN